MSDSKQHSERLKEIVWQRVLHTEDAKKALALIDGLQEQLEAQQRLLLAADAAFKWIGEKHPRIVREMPGPLYLELRDARVPFPAISLNESLAQADRDLAEGKARPSSEVFADLDLEYDPATGYRRGESNQDTREECQ